MMFTVSELQSQLECAPACSDIVQSRHLTNYKKRHIGIRQNRIALHSAAMVNIIIILVAFCSSHFSPNLCQFAWRHHRAGDDSVVDHVARAGNTSGGVTEAGLPHVVDADDPAQYACDVHVFDEYRRHVLGRVEQLDYHVRRDRVSGTRLIRRISIEWEIGQTPFTISYNNR